MEDHLGDTQASFWESDIDPIVVGFPIIQLLLSLSMKFSGHCDKHCQPENPGFAEARLRICGRHWISDYPTTV